MQLSRRPALHSVWAAAISWLWSLAVCRSFAVRYRYLMHVMRSTALSWSVAKQDQKNYAALCADWNIEKIVKIVEGGPSREHSVLNGIQACDREIGYVAIHDAARPLITEEIITEAVQHAVRDSAAAPGVAVKDSIQRIKKDKMIENIDRSSIIAVQTPQCFDIDLINAALTKAIDNGVKLTDDCGAVTAMGQPVSITKGSYENIKITTPEDIILGEAILKGRKHR